MKLTPIFLAAIALAGAPVLAQDASTLLDSMDENTLRAHEKVAVSVVEGQSGKALKLDFAPDARGAFVPSRVRGSAGWDKAAGFSFWVKGDGSPHLGGLEVVWNEDYTRRYALAFRIDSTRWKQFKVRWSDLVPETAVAPSGIGTPGLEASKLGPITFGKWHYWSDYAAHSYTIDDIRLEPTIEAVSALPPQGDPLARVRAKLRAGQPITVVTMGDSLTDFRHWSNKESNWQGILGQKLKEKHGSQMKLINPAIGGSELRHNVVLLPRWVQTAPAPDLVTVFFGFNDWASGMRGEAFQGALEDAVRRIRAATNGKADVMLLSTRPNRDNAEELSELAVATREAARRENAGLADVSAAFGAREGEDRAALYAWDKVHLSAPGHQVVAQAVLAAIEGKAG